jgi:3-methylcrotonyl-CoA carboxylase alpha subunit
VRPIRLRAGAAGAEREVTVLDAGTIGIGDMRFGVELVAPGTWRVTRNGHASIVHVAADKDGWWAYHRGRIRRVDVAIAGGGVRRRAAAADHGLVAPMPATVLSVMAEVGQAVKAGDTVIMLEAMKMELPVRAPRDGIVSAVHCREGELVQPGVMLLEIT